MDSLFGIGFPELVFILIISTLVLGPERMRDVARTLGRYIVKMRAVASQLADQFNAELDALDAPEIREAVAEVKKLREDSHNLRQEITNMQRELADERETLRQTVREGQQAVESARNEPTYKPVSRPAPGNGDDREQAHTNLPPAPYVPDPEDLPTPIDVRDDPE